MSQHTHTLKKIAEHLKADIQGDPNALITGVGSLATARTGQLSFLSHSRYQKYLADTQASAVILTEDQAKNCPVSSLIVSEPQLAFAKAAQLFNEVPKSKSGIHPTATIGDRCSISPSASIGAHCVIGDEVVIGNDCVIHPGVTLGDRVILGSSCILWSQVVLYYGVKLGDHVTLHSGVVVGSDGFGLINDDGVWIKMPQLGSVSIGNHVEVGANTVIDRGAIDDTVLEDGVKLDNLIQIAHNVRIGSHTAIAACTAIAGSARIGSYCMIGGMVAINGHIELADGVILTSGSTVSSSIKESGVYSSGIPAHSNREWRKNAVRFQQLDDIARRLSRVEKKVYD